MSGLMHEDAQPQPPDPAELERRRVHRERMRQLRASAIGLQFVASIAVGALGGAWVDRRFGVDPWGLVVGISLGAVAAYRDLVRLAREHQKEQ